MSSVRLHTHFAENSEDDEFSIATFGCRPMEYLERTGWCTDRTWVAHCVMPNPDEIVRLGAAGIGVAMRGADEADFGFAFAGLFEEVVDQQQVVEFERQSGAADRDDLFLDFFHVRKLNALRTAFEPALTRP